ncbi:uncharacterized protein EV154DRAFT_599810 [Mucor mucedo]|uniref:uncharacterized protein n=1 Tax=Mucor mucedo TaxID=29922 RepID=UPI00221F1C18|nr:uncharacterized protein EV154DRAFT_599810 [Mucor mucedo]KAI7894718.1 hypothetical protein EV154DRAFT_599810 [Mucor mucedo]
MYVLPVCVPALTLPNVYALGRRGYLLVFTRYLYEVVRVGLRAKVFGTDYLACSHTAAEMQLVFSKNLTWHGEHQKTP